jgi:hypothetical protein
MVGCGLPKTRPISCWDCPHFYDPTKTVETHYRGKDRDLAPMVNTTFEQLSS